MFRLEKNRKILAVIWFYIIDIAVKTNLGLQYEPESLEVKKVCFTM